MGAEDGQSPLSRGQLPAAGGVSRSRGGFPPGHIDRRKARQGGVLPAFSPGRGHGQPRARHRGARRAHATSPAARRSGGPGGAHRRPRPPALAGRDARSDPRLRRTDRRRAGAARRGADRSRALPRQRGRPVVRGARAALRGSHGVRRPGLGSPAGGAREDARQAPRPHRAAHRATSITTGWSRNSPSSRNVSTSTRRSTGCAVTSPRCARRSQVRSPRADAWTSSCRS